MAINGRNGKRLVVTMHCGIWFLKKKTKEKNIVKEKRPRPRPRPRVRVLLTPFAEFHEELVQATSKITTLLSKMRDISLKQTTLDCFISFKRK